MPTDIYALIYVSHSTIDMNAGGAGRAVQDILSKSRTKNASLGVTGALLFSEGCFSQVLEGPLGAVEAVYDAIHGDARHRDIILLSFKPAAARRFPGWSMAYAGVSTGLVWAANIEGLFASPSAIDAERSGLQLVELMTDLIRHQDIDRSAASNSIRLR